MPNTLYSGFGGVRKRASARCALRARRERSARTTRIIGDCKVSVEGDDIIIKGVSLEDVGQTSANLEQATKIKRKDQRIFLDGIYVYEKKKGW